MVVLAFYFSGGFSGEVNLALLTGIDLSPFFGLASYRLNDWFVSELRLGILGIYNQLRKNSASSKAGAISL